MPVGAATTLFASVLANATLGVLFTELLRASGRHGAAVSSIAAGNPQGENIMSGYELIGLDDDDDDDDIGAIGADILIGDDDDDDDDEISGDEDDVLEALVSGMGDSEIIGARKRRRRVRRAKKAKAIRRLAKRNAGAVISRGLERRRRYPLGFVPTNVTTGATQNIPAAPQNLFRPERLVIPSDIAFDLGVPDIKIGNMSQLVQDVELPGAIFSEVAIDTGVHFDTAEVGNQISCRARNKSAITIEFSAAVLGTIAK